MKRLILITGFFCLGAGSGFAYSIHGKLGNIKSCYYPRVYLEVIRAIDGFYTANAHNLLVSADVAPDGTFLLTGQDLPDEKMFFRLYATTSSSIKTYIKNGAKPNYVLLVLDNNTDETVLCDDFCHEPAAYTATTADNRLLARLALRRGNYLAEASEDLSESKKEFLKTAFRKEMLTVADTASGIAAFYAMELAEVSGPDLAAAADKSKHRFAGSTYTVQVEQKAVLDELPASLVGSMRFNIILSLLLIVSLLANLYWFLRRKKTVERDITVEQHARELIDALSIKEREILKMVHEGLSNKEIADRHNIEVSTVKTHVSRIYQKTGIRSRKEVASIARYA